MSDAQALSRPPEWNLDDLYAAPDDPALKSDLERAADAADAFRARYRGGLAALDGRALGEAIKAYEAIEEILGRAMSYAQLLFAGDISDPELGRFHQTIQERITDISTKTLFFTLEINRIDDAVLEKQSADEEVRRYAPWLRDVRRFRPHQLADDLETLLHEKSVTGRASWVRLFEETLADMRFEIAGERLSLADVLDRLSDRDGARRKAAAKSLGKGLAGNLRLFSLITNTLAKDKAIEDAWRSYARPVSARNLANNVEDEVVDALASSVKDAYPELAHRYYAMKARWMGAERLDYWDRNAPLEGDDAIYDWNDARRIVLDAYGRFAPEMAAIAERFFDRSRIDAALRPGKDSGAFAHPCVPSVHPYILMNFHGKARDVMTLAHELGHGVHQVLAADQGGLMAETPLTLAETASVFGEMLVFRALLEAETDPARRRFLLADKVEDMLGTVVRQIAFHEFETKVHDERGAGEISAERLGDIWMDAQETSLGPALRFDDDYRAFWAYIPHFLHTPFYVYAYAFGDCLVNSLYDVFDGGDGGDGDFQARYFAMLKAGGTLRHGELLAPFGLDATDPAFWKRGLSVIYGFIDELEKF